MLSAKTEGFCFGVVAVLTIVLLLNCLPVGVNTIPPVRLGTLYHKGINADYKKTSKSGIVAETIVFKDKFKNIVFIKDDKGNPITHIVNGEAVAWSPNEDVLLVKKTTEQGGYQLVDINKDETDNQGVDVVFGQSFRSARFSNEGKDIKIFTSDGFFKKLPVNTILNRTPAIQNLAMVDEE